MGKGDVKHRPRRCEASGLRISHREVRRILGIPVLDMEITDAIMFFDDAHGEMLSDDRGKATRPQLQIIAAVILSIVYIALLAFRVFVLEHAPIEAAADLVGLFLDVVL